MSIRQDRSASTAVREVVPHRPPPAVVLPARPCPGCSQPTRLLDLDTMRCPSCVQRADGWNPVAGAVMIELSTVLRDLRDEFGIAPGAEVPQRLVARALTQRMLDQGASPGSVTGPDDVNPGDGT
jgi:hypothetical protein